MERVRCKNCSEYVTKAESPMGMMDEEGVITFFKMTQMLSKTHGDLSEGITCVGCRGHSFELVEITQEERVLDEPPVEQETKSPADWDAESSHEDTITIHDKGRAITFSRKGADAVLARAAQPACPEIRRK